MKHNISIKQETKKIIGLIALSYAINIFALIVLMMKMFFPFTKSVSFTLYGISWGLFVFALKDLITKGYQKKKHLVIKYAPTFAIFFGLIFTLWVMLSLFPVQNFNLAQSDKIVLAEKMNHEQIYAEQYNKKLKETESLLLHEITTLDFASLNPTKKQYLRELWRDYLNYTTALESIVDQYKYFYQINVVTDKKLNEQAFVLAYASFVSPYASTLNLIQTIEKKPLTKTFFNEASLNYEIPENSYLKIQKKLLQPQNSIQATAGYAYLQNIDTPELAVLKKNAVEDYKNIVKHMGAEPSISISSATDYFERNAFTSWFPVQKSIAEKIGDTKIPLRDIALVDNNKIEEMQKHLMPGDVLLERRNWYLSNAGLPGFWKHTALYVGNLSDLDAYFPPSKLTENLLMSEYIAKKYPALYAELKDNQKRTVEAESEGVISFTLQQSLSADYVAVLRPKISIEEKEKALLFAFAQFGKPYDFDFDFLTDNSIVCSELYYKAYPMMNYSLRMISGRYVLSSNHIVQDFDQNYERQKNLFDFVYFVDANEKIRESFFSDEAGFRNSWKRTETDVVKTLVEK